MWYTVYCTCVFYLLFESYPHRMNLIASIPQRWMAWRKISAFNTYTCTILLCYHAFYSILQLMCMHIAIAFTCKSKRFLKKLKLYTRDLYRLIQWQIMWPWLQFTEDQGLVLKCGIFQRNSCWEPIHRWASCWSASVLPVKHELLVNKKAWRQWV